MIESRPDHEERRPAGSSYMPELKFVFFLAIILLLCVLTVHKGQISGDGIPRWNRPSE